MVAPLRISCLPRGVAIQSFESDAKGSKILGNLGFKDRSFGVLLTKIEGISIPCPIVAFVKDLNPDKNSSSSSVFSSCSSPIK